MTDMNQVPHSLPTNVRRNRTKFSRPYHLARSISEPLVSVLRVSQVCDVIYHASLLQPLGHKHVRGKFIAVQWKPPQTPHQSVWTPNSVHIVSLVPVCHSYIITRQSIWLFNFAEYSCRDHFNTEVPFGQHKCSFYELCLSSSVFRLRVFSTT